MRIALILFCLLVVKAGPVHADTSWTCIRQWEETPVYMWWDAMPETVQNTIVWRWYIERYPATDADRLWCGTVGELWEALPEPIKELIRTWQGWCRCRCEEPRP